jgi:hypothetical protein
MPAPNISRKHLPAAAANFWSTKYWLSTLDKAISFRRLVDIAKIQSPGGETYVPAGAMMLPNRSTGALSTRLGRSRIL